MEASKRTRKAARASNVKKDKETLEAGIWGKLQEHIPLQTVYEKLPHQDLFRLRLVCKEWNHAALQRLEPKPYFVIIALCCEQDQYLNGLLTYDVASEKFSFKRQRFTLHSSHSIDTPFEVEGLIFCHHPDNLKQQGVFNVHTKTWHAIPPAPGEKSEHSSAIGMMVDTSERPYSFKLIVGSLDRKTQIYDSRSRSWSTISSRLKQLAQSALSSSQPVTCMCSNGYVYISIGAEILLMYSIEGDTWTILDFPPVIQEEDGGGAVHALGVWEGRIFTTREDCGERNVTVWELVDRTKQEWVEYAVMSEGEYDMLMKCDFANNGPSIYEEMRLVPCFCNAYLLIYTWQHLNAQAEALAMLNLATKEWKQVDLPTGTVAMNEGSDIEGGTGEGSDDDEDAEEDEDSESDDMDPVCAATATCSKTYRQKIGRSKIAYHHIIGRCQNQRKLGGVRELEADAKIVKEKHNHDKMDSNCQLLPRGAPVVTSGHIRLPSGGISASVKAEKPSSTIGEIVIKPTLDKFECAMCGFGSDAPDDSEAHKKTKVHRVIEELRKEKKQHNKTPLSLLHEYASRNHYEVKYDTKAETNGPFEVIAIIGGAAGRTTGPPTKGFGAGRKKAKAKQMAAADALEKIMENVPELEFTKPGQSKQCFIDRDRPGQKGNLGGGEGSYPSKSNAKTITGYNDFPRAGSGSNYVDRYAGRGGTGYNMSLWGGRGGMPSHPETHTERYGRIQGGRGSGGGGYGGREYLGGVVKVGGNSYGSQDVGGIGCDGRELPAALGYGGRELNPGGGYGGSSREYEGAGIKRLHAAMDEDARYLDAQRGLPRQHLEALEHVPIQQSGGVQGYGAQSMYSDAPRAPVVCPQEHLQYNAYGQQSQGLHVLHNIGQAQHTSTQHLSAQRVRSQHVPSQHISTQHIQTQHVPTQHVQTQHISTQHVQTQQAKTPITMVDGPGQGGTPYSIYDVAPQSTVGVPTGTGQTATHTYSHQYAPGTHNYGGYANQEYVVNTAVPVQEMAQATSHPAQSA